MRTIVMVAAALAAGWWLGAGSRAAAGPAADVHSPFYVTQDTTSVTVWRRDGDRIVEATQYRLVTAPTATRDLDRVIEAQVYLPPR